MKLFFECGKEVLEFEFCSLMMWYSKVVLFVFILDLISGDDDLEV